MSEANSGRANSGRHPQAGGTIAELSVAAEAIRSYQGRVGGLATSWRTGISDGGDDDVVAAIHEAERSLGVAERAIRRAIKLADRR